VTSQPFPPPQPDPVPPATEPDDERQARIRVAVVVVALVALGVVGLLVGIRTRSGASSQDRGAPAAGPVRTDRSETAPVTPVSTTSAAATTTVAIERTTTTARPTTTRPATTRPATTRAPSTTVAVTESEPSWEPDPDWPFYAALYPDDDTVIDDLWDEWRSWSSSDQQEHCDFYWSDDDDVLAPVLEPAFTDAGYPDGSVWVWLDILYAACNGG
jgi:hypothetical protein